MKTTSSVRTVLRMALVGVLLAMPLAAQAAGNDYDKLGKGPKIGTTIPQPLAATDHAGKVRDFASLKGQRGLVLLFSRSLSW